MSHLMSKTQKIEKLLEITGCPGDKLELARRNYERLAESDGEGALDARIAEFEDINRQVRNWREARVAQKCAELRREAVDLLMRFHGVPESDFELCRQNMDRLSDEEIDKKLCELLPRWSRIEVWRRTRGSPTGNT